MVISAATERWPSGRRRTPGKCVYGNVSRVRIPPSPPSKRKGALGALFLFGGLRGWDENRRFDKLCLEQSLDAEPSGASPRGGESGEGSAARVNPSLFAVFFWLCLKRLRPHNPRQHIAPYTIFFIWPRKLKVAEGMSWVMKITNISSLGSTQKRVEA